MIMCGGWEYRRWKGKGISHIGARLESASFVPFNHVCEIYQTLI